MPGCGRGRNSCPLTSVASSFYLVFIVKKIDALQPFLQLSRFNVIAEDEFEIKLTDV